MFIGHYGAALAAKRAAPQLSLGGLFLAVQALDLLFSVLVLAGVEKMRIVPGFTRVNAYDITWMPYSHGLVSTLGWSVLVGAGYAAVARRTPAKARLVGAVVLGAAVASHFLCDLPVHTPDLPITLDGSGPKLGFGLWNSVPATLALELGSLAIGGAVYLGATTPLPGGKRATRITVVTLLLMTITTPFLPDPNSAAFFAVEALFAYLALAALAEWMDRKRRFVPTANA